MELEVRRPSRPEKGFCMGEFWIDGRKFCDCLEPEDRGLRDTMPLREIQLAKNKGLTAIPRGKYSLIMGFSARFSRRQPFKSFDGLVPRLQFVKGYEGILIHCGNTVSDTRGCILLGQKIGRCTLGNSQATMKKFLELVVPTWKNHYKLTLSI